MVAYQKKAPLGGAFFVLCCGFPLLFAGGSAAAAPCKAPAHAEPAEVGLVIDGDTLKLKDGRVVRLIGIDTPELGHGKAPDQPGAREARDGLSARIETAGRQVLIEAGRDRSDRHRRLLAHLFTPQGDNLTAELLLQGLGRQAVVAPNVGHLDCYRDAEARARTARRGLWARAVTQAGSLQEDATGFHLIAGEVRRVGRGSSALWLDLSDKVSVKIPWKLWREMGDEEPDHLLQRRLEVRGWFYRYRGRLGVTVSHPAAIRWL